MDFDPCVGILGVQKGQKKVLILIYFNRDSNLSITIGLTSSIKILTASFPSLKGFSIWNCLIFAQVVEFSWRSKIPKIATVIVFLSIFKLIIC